MRKTHVSYRLFMFNHVNVDLAVVQSLKKFVELFDTLFLGNYDLEHESYNYNCYEGYASDLI